MKLTPILRLGAAAVLVAAGVTLMVCSGAFRGLEAGVGATLTGALTHARTLTYRSEHTFFWFTGPPNGFRGLTVTPECTSAFVAGPILIGAGGFLGLRRLQARRVVVAGLVAAAVAVVTNLLRLGLIGWATYHWQTNGFDWTHTVVGSLMTVLGAFAAVVVFVKLAFGPRRPVEAEA